MAVSNGLASAEDEESPAVLEEPLLQYQQQRQQQESMRLRRSQSNTSSQVAIVGSNLCPIESLDYEIIENDFFKQDWRSRGKTQIFQYILIRWIFCFLIGVIVGLLGFFNNLAVENIAGIKFVITSNMMLARKYTVAFLVFASSNFGLTLFASLITAFIAPEAAGSGIPEVKAYLNGVDAPAIFSLRTLIIKKTRDSRKPVGDRRLFFAGKVGRKLGLCRVTLKFEALSIFRNFRGAISELIGGLEFSGNI